MQEPVPVDKAEYFRKLPPGWPDRELLTQIRQRNLESGSCIVALDDDPTGTQTVHDIPVLTNWKLPTIIDEFHKQTPLFYLLTNSRSLPQNEAINLARTIGTNILQASRQTHRSFEVISRSDSTLRGHFPAEVDALADALGLREDVLVIIPFFEEGGRFTINDVHYVRQGQQLIPAARTDFAKDVVFGYGSSNLKQWIEEKTQGKISAYSGRSLSIDDLRNKGPEHIAEKLLTFSPGETCIVNAADYRDLKVATLALLKAGQKGKRFLYRTAASFVRVRAGLSARPLLTADEMDTATDQAGGFTIVGSHVTKSSRVFFIF